MRLPKFLRNHPSPVRDILPAIQDALERQKPFAWARVVTTWGSAPRRPGAAMIVVAPDDYAGSVSGGCVEHAVIDEALASLVTGRPQILDYGIRDETAWSAGLSCGGRLRVLVEPFPACSLEPGVRNAGRSLLLALNEDRPVVLATPLVGDASPRLVDEGGPLASAAAVCLATREPAEVDNGEIRWFLHPFPSRDRLVIVGGSDIAVHLIPLAHAVEFETILIDPRRVLADGRRFQVKPDRLFVESPESALRRLGVTDTTYAVLLTHEPSVDDPALHALLAGPARYIGALGGKKTQESRRERLRAAGYDEETIARIDGPVGVPIGAATPAEIAVSIVARLVEARRGAPVR